MENRPVIKVAMQKTDIILESISWLILILAVSYLLVNVSLLPDRIPVHFNARGEADGYGPRNSLYFIVIFPFAINVLLTILSRYPHRFNYLNKITEENAAYQYKLSIRLLRILKISIAIIFFLIIHEIIQNAQQAGLSKSGPVLLIILPIVMIPVIWYVFTSSKSSTT